VIDHYKIVLDLYEFVESEYQKNCYFCASVMLIQSSPNIYKRIKELDEELHAAKTTEEAQEIAGRLKENWRKLFQRFNGMYPQRRMPSMAKASIAVRFFPLDEPWNFLTFRVTDTNPDIVLIVKREDLTAEEVTECLQKPQNEWPFWMPARVRGIATEPGVAQLDPALVQYLKGPAPSAKSSGKAYSYVDEDGSEIVPSDDDIFGDESPSESKVDKVTSQQQNVSRASSEDDLSEGTTPSDAEIFDFLE
jgi:hypothetical protein